MSASVNSIALMMYCQKRFKAVHSRAKNQLLSSSPCIYLSFENNVFFCLNISKSDRLKVSGIYLEHFKPGRLLKTLISGVVRRGEGKG